MAKKAKSIAKKAKKKSRPITRVWKSVKFSPDAPEARDEGPRLIPLAPAAIPALPDHNRYLALADEALGTKPNALAVKTKF